MAFTNKDLLHGAAIAVLARQRVALEVKCVTDQHSDAYELRLGDKTLLVMMKYSTKKKSPWQFSFGEPQAKAIQQLVATHRALPLVFAFVCHNDGVCAVLEQDLEFVGLGAKTLEGASITVSRPRGGSYWISGPGRTKMPRAVPQSRWLSIFDDVKMGVVSE